MFIFKFYFTTISMVTIWPNVIIPCSCTHIYWCFQKSPPPTPASHWPLHLWLWLTYPWSSGYQPFEIWHQTFCIVGVLDRAFFWFWPPILPKHIKQFKGAFHTLMEEMVTLVVCLLYSRAQLFEGWLALTQGYILIWVSLFLYSKAFLGKFSVSFLKHQIVIL